MCNLTNIISSRRNLLRHNFVPVQHGTTSQHYTTTHESMYLCTKKNTRPSERSPQYDCPSIALNVTCSPIKYYCTSQWNNAHCLEKLELNTANKIVLFIPPLQHPRVKKTEFSSSSSPVASFQKQKWWYCTIVLLMVVMLAYRCHCRIQRSVRHSDVHPLAKSEGMEPLELAGNRGWFPSRRLRRVLDDDSTR